MKDNLKYYRLLVRFLLVLAVAMAAVLMLSCKKENLTYKEKAVLECGDPIVWIYHNELQYTQLILHIMPMDEESQTDPITSFWWTEQGTYTSLSYDWPGPDYECYLFHKYKAYALIDGHNPLSLGYFVFYEEGMIRNVNVLDGISWN